MKLEFFRRVFEKYSNTEFHENPSVEAELFHVDWERQTEKYDSGIRRFSQFFEQT
jgi:hypothetical protein